MFGNRSLFRHAACKPYKKEETYILKLLPEPSATSHAIAASAKFIAAAYGSKGNVIILPTHFEDYTRRDDPNLISAHGSEMADLSFSPHSDNLLATGGDDLVKLWTIPDGGLSSSMADSTVAIGGFNSVACLKWHPSAQGIAAVGSKGGFNIVDFNKGESAYSASVSGNNKDIVAAGWSLDGSQLALLGKNSMLFMVDPRTAPSTALEKGIALEDRKPQHALWINSKNNILLTVGLDKTHQPTVSFWDPKNLAKPVARKAMEMSTGFTLPLYDYDTDIFVGAIRGSGMLSLFDVTPGAKGEPGWFKASSFTSDEAFKGACLVPKRGSDFLACEVNRVVVLGETNIRSIAIQVPRKDRGFHQDLFPMTADMKPALSSEEYRGGANKNPLLVNPVKYHDEEAKRKADGPSASSGSSAAAPSAARVLVPEKVVEAPKEEKKLEFKMTHTRKALDDKLKRTIFQHANGHEPREKSSLYFDLKPSETLPLARNIAANGVYVCIPWEAVGGSAVAVIPLTRLGRTPEKQFCVRGHKTQVTAFDLSPHDDTLMASACDGAAEVKLWKLPQDGQISADITEAHSTFETGGKVSYLRFHPLISDVLVVGATVADGAVVQFWDIHNTSGAKITLSFFREPVLDVDYHYKGSLIAVSSKDKRVRVIDPRKNQVISDFEPEETLKDTRVLWTGDESLLVVGFGRGSRRTVSLWDTKNKKKLGQAELPTSQATMIPFFDEDTRVLFVSTVGSAAVQMFQINEASPHIDPLSTFNGAGDVTGHFFLKKKTIDVRKVEIARSLKLARQIPGGYSIFPVTWTVPRKRVEFFQDDIYTETRADVALYTAAEFFSNASPAGRDPDYYSLQPADMTPLSKAPEEEMTERQKKYQEQLKKKDAPKKFGVLGHSSAEEVGAHFKEVAKSMPSRNRWDAQTDNTQQEVHEDEWD